MTFSYQHRYHAGCFADVHKHLTLLAILQSLHKKATPFCVLDTHAGEGLYDLNSVESQKTAERTIGIDKLWSLQNPPELAQTFLAIMKTYNKPEECRFYPGSPAIIKSLLRTTDSALLVEKHPQAIAALRAFFAHDKQQQIHIHERDSLEAMRALVPFPEKRGLVFIDPSYEVKAEYETIVAALHRAYQHFSHGIFALWYPVLQESYHDTLLKHLKRTTIAKMWHCVWRPVPSQISGMQASGMVVINPPWQLELQLTSTFQAFNQTLFTGGQFQQGWLS